MPLQTEQKRAKPCASGTDLRLPAGMHLDSSQEEMDDDRLRRLEEMAFRHGRYYDSYLITEPDRQYLWSSEDHGVLGFSRRGRYLNVAGGLICGEYHRAAFLAEIVEFVRLNNLVISFFSIDDTEAELFRAAGFQISRFGVETRIDLTGLEWKGKPYEWVRRQANYVTRQSVVFEEWETQSVTGVQGNARFDELKSVSDEHIAGKPQKGEIPFFEGRLLQDHLHRRRIFVARHDETDGRVEGFAVCNPMHNGEAWSIEMYRQRNDAPRGTIPFLIKRIVDQLKDEGCEQVSICPVPTIGTQRPLPGSALAARAGMYLWAKLGPVVYDCQGLYHFKSRFRPDFSDVFICAYPGSTWRAVWAYIMTLGTFEVNWGSVLRKLLSFKIFTRKLATPRLERTPVKSPNSKTSTGQIVELPGTKTPSPTSRDAAEPEALKRVS